MKIFISLLILFLFGCSEAVLEVQEADQEGVIFQENFDALNPDEIQDYSSEAALDSNLNKEGKSLLLNSEGAFELQIVLQQQKTYNFSFWQKGKGAVIKVKTAGDANVEFKENHSYQSKDGWNKTELVVNTYFLDKKEIAHFSIENPSKKAVLIDDIQISQLITEVAEFELEFKKKDLNSLIELRNKAYHSHYIKSSFKKNVPAKLNKETAKVKLKGDWKDHILTGIWSFKVTSDNEVLKNSNQVTFQNLKARNMLKEWLFLELCKDAGIVTPFYEVTTLSINQSAPYLCVAEESFADGFIKRKKGYDAPVLRLYEDFLFPHWVKGWGGKKTQIPELENSFIYPYDPSKYLTGKYADQFHEHAEALKQFIVNDSVLHLIDREKWATLFAIQSLTRSYHSLTWHNTRFFVNSKGLIEPIAYDGSSNDGSTESWYGGGVYGNLNKYFKSPTVAVSFTNKLFLDASFLSLYKKKLALYAEKQTIANFIKLHDDEFEHILSRVKKYYDYDLSITYLERCRERLAEQDQDFNNEKFKGQKSLFFRPLSFGNAPSDKFYTSELVRGYIVGDEIRFINGTNQAVLIQSENSQEVKVEKFSDAYIKKINAIFFVEVDGEKIEIEVCPWVPVS